MGNANNAKHKVTKSTLKKYKKKIYSSKDAVMVTIVGKSCVEANDAAVEMFEASSRDELIKFQPELLSPKFQSHLNKTTQEVIMEGWKKISESAEGYLDLVFEHVSIKGNHFFVHVWVTAINFLGQLAAQSVLKKVQKPNPAEKKIESISDVDTSLIKPKFDDESSDTLFDSQSETNLKSEKQTSNGALAKDNLDKEIQRLDKELEKGMKEKARLERIKFKVLEKQLNEKIQENTQLKNEIFVIQQLLDEMKKSNQNENESQFQEEIERIKEKKKKFKTEVERLTNRLKMVEFEKENLKKLM
ncbi:elks/rab6-interacting/cast protein [Anaeramoeba ignava]|uniref:Elks/rab6-interacting/cast protein n=1 Tax=Anaeramoeba ignava TaxID=1746090 RepID=A0A9Q0LDX5_ANAIG|nr:elks/rab6-interacting/cast protein [Anaeramoeba ignava]